MDLAQQVGHRERKEVIFLKKRNSYLNQSREGLSLSVLYPI